MHTAKPISRVLSWTVIPLGTALLTHSSNLPEHSASSVNVFCLVLLRMGFSLLQLVTKCTVRSYRTISPLPDPLARPSAVMLSVPLSVALRRPAVSRHPTLWSPDFPPLAFDGERRLSSLPVCEADYSSFLFNPVAIFKANMFCAFNVYMGASISVI